MTCEPWVHDVRLAWRGLRRAKGFTAAAVLTLAVGMAGVTAMFALIQGVLLRPLPMTEPERLVAVWKEPRSTGSHWPLTAAEFQLIREAAEVFAGVAAVGYNDPGPTEVVDGTSTEFIHTARVSADFFEVLGVRPFLGRALNRGDGSLELSALAVVVTPLLQGLLYEVHPLDPAALVTATLILLGAAVVASYLPARTAGRMNPLTALRDP